MSTMTIEVTEELFSSTADAAHAAYEAGNFADADRLDELARRMNDTLTGSGFDSSESPLEAAGLKDECRQRAQEAEVAA